MTNHDSFENRVSTTVPSQGHLTQPDFWTDEWIAHQPRRRRFPKFWKCIKSRADRHLIRLLSKLIDLSGTRSGSLIEIGCAPGIILEQLHAACPTIQLHGIDYSERGLELARRRMDAAGINVSMHLGDVFQTGLERRFDIVFSGGVIEHFDDPVPMLKRHADYCKPGGHVIVTVPNFSAAVPKFFLKHFDPEVLAVHNLATMNLDRLREAMALAGLENIQVGQAGPPRLHEDHGANRRLGRVFSVCAKLWNMGVFVIPSPPLWHANFWAVGRLPPND